MRDVLCAQMRCFDAWSRVGGLRESEVTHKAFVDWIMNVFTSSQTDSHPGISEYLSQTVSNHLHVYSKEQVLEKVSSRSLSRTFRVTVACNIDPQDTRIRNLVDHLITSSGRFPFYTLICPFFTHVRQVPSSAPRASCLKEFGTQCATVFEKCLFLTLLSEIGNSLSSIRPSKTRKRKLSEDATSLISNPADMLFVCPEVKSFRRKDGSFSQRLAKILQIIVKAWDKFSVHLGFPCCEAMLQPYLRVTSNPLTFSVISTREEGYASSETSEKILLDGEPVLQPSETFPHCVEFPDSVDSALRQFATRFLNDVRRNVFNDRVYEESPYDIYDRLQKFLPSGISTASRFQEFEDQIVRTVRVCSRRFFPNISPGSDVICLPSSTEQHIGPEDVSGKGCSSAGDSDFDLLDELVEETPGISFSDADRRVCKEAMLLKEAVEGHVLSLGETHMEVTNDERMIFKQALRGLVHMYGCEFSSFEDAYEADGSVIEIFGNTQFVYLDPPYNVRRLRQRPLGRSRDKFEYDNLSVEEMDDVVDLVARLLRPGGHAVVMCSVQQFHIWEQKFRSFDLEDASNPTSGAFTVDKVPLVLVFAPQYSISNPGRASSSLQSAADFAVHVKRNGLPFEAESGMVTYRTFNYVMSSFPATKNVIDKVPGLSVGEMLQWKPEKSEEASLPLNYQMKGKLRPEQRPVALLQELISRFSKPGDIVVDFFAGTFSTAVACMALPKHRIFFGCEKDQMCFDIALENVLRMFAEFTSSPIRITDVRLTRQQLHIATKLRLLQRKRKGPGIAWVAPESLPQFQYLPEHIMAYFAHSPCGPAFLRTIFRTPIQNWPVSFRRRLNEVNIRELVVLDACKFTLSISPSLIKVDGVGVGVFAGRHFSEDDVVCLYYGTLVYADLSTRTSATKLYGDDGVLGVSKNRFQRYAIQVKTTGKGFSEVHEYASGERCIYIVPAPFCVGGYINDYRYSTRDEEYAESVDLNTPFPSRRHPNVMFVQSPSLVRTARELESSSCVVVKAIRTINRGEELYCDYQSDNFDMEALK